MPPPAAVLKKKAASKNPPILSQEFFIQNHGDIACAILMILTLGTIVQATSPYCAAFFFGPRHNVTNFDSLNAVPAALFNYGYKDLAMLFSYTLICITVHAIWQEYVLDKLHKKLHLSKTKNAKFFESGQLILFDVFSVAWAILIFKEEGYLHSGLDYLWRDYPYTGMTAWTKLYFIIQFSYWLHQFPELYLQKVRKEEIPVRVVYTSLYLITILYGYLTRFWRISIVLLTVHYLIEIFYHSSRLAHFYATTKTNSPSAKSISRYLFQSWNIVFVFGRLVSVVLTWLTFWFGLRSSSVSRISFTSTPSTHSTNENGIVSEPTVIANFNTLNVRLFTLVLVGALQFWLVWNFIQFHMRRRRDQRNVQSTSVSAVKASAKPKQKPQADATNGDQTAGQPVKPLGSRGNKKDN